MTQFIKTLEVRRIILPILLTVALPASANFTPKAGIFHKALNSTIFSTGWRSSSKRIPNSTSAQIGPSAGGPPSGCPKWPKQPAEISIPMTNSISCLSVDRATLASLLMNNPEWVRGKRTASQARDPGSIPSIGIRAIFYMVEDKDFFLAFDPVIQQTQSIETGNSERVLPQYQGSHVAGA